MTLATTDVKTMTEAQLKAELELLDKHEAVVRYKKVYNKHAMVVWTAKQKAKAASAKAEVDALKAKVEALEAAAKKVEEKKGK